MPDKSRLKVVPLSAIAANRLPRQRVQILPPQPIQKNTRPQGGFFMDKVHKKRAALARSFLRLSQPYINKTKIPDKIRLKVVPLSAIARDHLMPLPQRIYSSKSANRF